MTQAEPRIGVALVLTRGTTVLLGKRKGSHGEGSWGFPGGHLELGESWEGCATRECLEETGLTPKNIHFWTATNDVFNEQKHYVTLFMRAEADGEPHILEPNKCEEWRWYTWDSLPENLFLPIRNLIKNGYNPFT